MRIIITIVFLSLHLFSSAQTTEEWLQQKETQKKYFLQQIAALKIYLNYAEKGYRIAQIGLQTIRSIKKGDFDLHSTFFNSLKQVNPQIKAWSRVGDIIALQVKIVKQTKAILNAAKEQNQFTANEIDYCRDVFERLLDDCLKEIDDLILVTTDGELEMKDDERMKRIENIFLHMQDHYSFVSSFGDEMKVLSLQRLKEQKEIELSKMLDK